MDLDLHAMAVAERRKHDRFEKKNRAAIDRNELKIPTDSNRSGAFDDCKPGDEVSEAFSIAFGDIGDEVPYP